MAPDLRIFSMYQWKNQNADKLNAYFFSQLTESRRLRIVKPWLVASLPRSDGDTEMRDATCAANMLVTLNGATKTAKEWADERGLKWQTVKMRRYRGGSWEEALHSELQRTSWMKEWAF